MEPLFEENAVEVEVTDDVDLLLTVLPPRIAEAAARESREDLLEIVLDLGRPAEARYPGEVRILGDTPVTPEEIAHVVSRTGAFTSDNRAGIEGTLHRIAALRNRRGDVIGLTCRIGRAVTGTVAIVRDLFESGHGVLLLGRPGIGKTTLLREAARVLADELSKRVVIVDTSNEIAGDGDVPHPGIGKARRMQVASPELQHRVMIEAVENHMPEVIVVDEIGTHQEALAARTIAERGVQLIATAHGTTLENLLANPTLADLVGGIESVTLGDEEARRRRTQKTILERKAAPTFEILIEIQDRHRFSVHRDVAVSVDSLLAGRAPSIEIRERRSDGSIDVRRQEVPLPVAPRSLRASSSKPPRRLFPYGVSFTRLERAVRALGVPAGVTPHLKDAEMVVTLRSQRKKMPPKLVEAERRGLPIVTLHSNTQTQMEALLESLYETEEMPARAVAAVEAACETVVDENRPVELAPAPGPVRRRQHEIATERGLLSQSHGREPFRAVMLYPPLAPKRPA